MTKPAARVGDPHTCPMTGSVPHVGGPVLPPGAGPTTLVGGQPAARMGDQCQCVGAVDTIAKGAMPVRIENRPAARQDDLTAHGGWVTLGHQNCLIGLRGISGNMLEGIEACRAAARGRNPPAGQLNAVTNAPLSPNTASQSYNNCGVESARQIINHATGANVGQEALLQQSIDNGLASPAPEGTPAQHQMYQSGGTNPSERTQILTNNGVAASELPPTNENLESAAGNGQGVIASVWAGNMPNWSGVAPNTGGHAVLVTGVEYDENGNPINVIINDTGRGQCGQRIPYDAFQNALRPGRNLNVTNDSIW